MLQESLLSMGIDFLRRKSPDIFEGDRNPFHGHYIESRLLEVTREHVVDLPRKVGHTDKFFNLESPQGLDLSHAGRHNRNPVLLFPLRDDPGLSFITMTHERRRTFRMDEIDLVLGQFRHFGLVRVERLAKLILGPLAESHKERNHADPLREQTDKLLQRSRPHRGLDHTDYPAPTGVGHNLPSLRTDGCRYYAKRRQSQRDRWQLSLEIL